MFAADAVARLSGVVGVAAITAGPGKGLHFSLFQLQLHVKLSKRYQYLWLVTISLILLLVI